MARPLRIEFPGAIYHAMSRGNARQEASRGQAWFSVFTTTADTMRQSARGGFAGSDPVTVCFL